MIPKKLLLFSTSLLMLATVCAQAQQAPSAPTAPQAETAPAIALGAVGGNYLGVTTTEVTRENMGRYNLREPRGVVITRVAEGSPAARAGLMAGDVILRFDNEQVMTFRKLQRLISEAAPEQNIRLAISRNGSEQEISVTLGKRLSGYQGLIGAFPVQQGEEARRSLELLQRNQGAIGFGWGRRIGVSTTQLTKQLADYFGITGGKGLLITTVAENSPAARAGLKAGDVITDAEGERIESSGDLSRAINRKTDGDVTLTVVRDRSQRTIRVTPEKREAGAISISPELLDIDLGSVEITMPSINLRLPQIKQAIPINLPRIKIPQIKIKPEQLRMLEKLQSLESLTLI